MNGANEPTCSELYRSDAEDAEGDRVSQPDGATSQELSSFSSLPVARANVLHR